MKTLQEIIDEYRKIGTITEISALAGSNNLHAINLSQQYDKYIIELHISKNETQIKIECIEE